MNTKRVTAGIIILIAVFFGYFIYASEALPESSFSRFPFKLGLDLQGGTHLLYEADLSQTQDKNDSLESLRDVIERRVNIFGVSEPLVQVEKSVDENGDLLGRLVVELPGVTNVDEATALIGQTPVLDFRIENPDRDLGEVAVDENGFVVIDPDEIYLKTELTGKNLESAQVQFNQINGEAYVSLRFDDEGAELFEEITRENIGKTVAIYLDGVPISTPVVQQAISGGEAQITGNFTPEEAKLLVGRLNAGALPVPISLLSSQSIGATLGEEAVARGVTAGLLGFVLVSLFMIVWYRVPGFFAVISLLFYLLTLLTLFKLIPVTLTAAGIAGLILSFGLAVDANVLIFERLKEELRTKGNVTEAIENAFARAWLSIRDANATSILTAIILFWFGTSLIKGFALTLGIGVLVSMFSAIVFTKALLLSVQFTKQDGRVPTALKSGFGK